MDLRKEAITVSQQLASQHPYVFWEMVGLFGFLPTFGETRQLADFLAFLGMQRGRAAYAVTGENLLSPPRLGCHSHGITKSGPEPLLGTTSA